MKNYALKLTMAFKQPVKSHLSAECDRFYTWLLGLSVVCISQLCIFYTIYMFRWKLKLFNL